MWTQLPFSIPFPSDSTYLLRGSGRGRLLRTRAIAAAVIQFHPDARVGGVTLFRLLAGAESFKIVQYCITATRKTLDSRHACGGCYGNGIFRCILGVKERALFHLGQIEPTEISFRFVPRSKTISRLTKCA
ncbi:hypothetical protein AVEN_114963-1 [Araneus ventricosus]|uniref:Uncharacterized protein n=1 Tax=Araneus ventricosus TaxID=182803 RepID=A0A4Y2D810_ARAVE|nr:hypothetical protein AVEN_114963-1 [Araneus ventricosus]